MSQKTVTEKPSQTALFAALRRALAHIEFNNELHGPDHLATKMLPPYFRFFLKFKRIQDNTKTRLEEALPGLNNYMIARTAFFDEQFQKAIHEDFEQIVILGAGYDTRAYRFLSTTGKSKIIELDTAPTQEQKIAYLKTAKISTDHVTFASIDFNTQSILEVLEKNGYSFAKKTLFIWEGVTYYLNPESVASTLKQIATNTHPDSLLVFDYTIPTDTEESLALFGVKEFKDTMEREHANESLVFNLAQDKVESYLTSQNYKLLEHYDNNQIESNYLMDKQGQSLGKMTGHFRFIIAQIA